MPLQPRRLSTATGTVVFNAAGFTRVLGGGRRTRPSCLSEACYRNHHLKCEHEQQQIERVGKGTKVLVGRPRQRPEVRPSCVVPNVSACQEQDNPTQKARAREAE